MDPIEEMNREIATSYENYLFLEKMLRGDEANDE